MKRIKLITCLLLGALMLTGCKKETVNIESLFNQAAELGTVQYTVQKIIKGGDEGFWGDRAVLFSLKIYIKAGIDLTKFDEDDVTINKKEKSIKIKLPQPEIFSYDIRSDDIKESYSQTGLFRSNFSNKERDYILQQGEAAIMSDQDLTSQILKDAETNARTFFELLLMQNGFEKVTITFKK